MRQKQKDEFSISGPIHHETTDWKNTHHRREVAACLVQGASVLERDRQKKRVGTNALALPWWEFFHFELYYRLLDDVDGSIFGAIYKLKTPVEGAPRYVIAFRGTNKRGSSIKRDLELDWKLITHRLHLTSRYEIAMQKVQDIVAAAGGSNVWLAGHSLGAAIGMLVGKNMAKEGTFLEAFLFNPPYNSAFSANEFIKNGHPRRSQSDDSFVALSAWVPNIFMNPSDPINWLTSQFKKAIGRGSVDSEPLHLLPSANLTINPCRSPAHGIRQWWAPNLPLESKELKVPYFV